MDSIGALNFLLILIVTVSVEAVLKVGNTVIFTSFMDNSVITVKEDGNVTTELAVENSPMQRWIVARHPNDPNALEFKHALVPHNTLSGFQDPPENPGLFPRPLGLAERNRGNIVAWNILIRGRWCIQANGYGYSMDMDDCESFEADYQLWSVKEISS